MESDTPRTDLNEWVARVDAEDPSLGLIVFDERVVDAKFARELERELAAAIKQRDEARREWCYMESCRRCEYAIEPSDERSIAAERGWDCFKEGGGA